jgi:hypothetical protein
MNYIDINEAVEATGKSSKTIRRLLSKKESKPFIDRKEGKIFVDVNYLFASYPSVNNMSKSIDIVQDTSIDNEISQLKSKITIYEQEIKHKNELLAEKEGRIGDLQKAMLLLNPSAEQQKKKIRWWHF